MFGTIASTGRTDVPNKWMECRIRSGRNTTMAEYSGNRRAAMSAAVQMNTMNEMSDWNYSWSSGAAYHERAALARENRRREVNRIYAAIIIVSALIILFGSFLLFGMTSNASVENEDQTFKYYTSVMLTLDQNIHDVAAIYADPVHYSSPDAYLTEVCEINHLGYFNGEVEGAGPGTHIIVPYYSSRFSIE